MKKYICFKVFLVYVVILMDIAAVRANSPSTGFDKVLLFAGADNVRIEITFRTVEPLAGVELTGRIVPFKGGAPLWEGALGRLDVKQGAASPISQTITGLKPQLWSPVSPTLYNLTVTARWAGRVVFSETIRFGFRSFENRDGQFFLNGKPIFLRGIAINPPGRGIPAPVGESRRFAESYVRYLKTQNVNTIRLEHDSQIWFDVCDELGMMVYQGVYGAPPGSNQTDRTEPPTDFEKSMASYQSLFETYVRHPSIVIYILSNEMPYKGQRGAAFTEFLNRAHEHLRRWDATRLYIGNAGYGEGFSGDVRDVHRYWGWYYNTFLTYYNLRDENLFGDPNKIQPFTFTECVGNFTGPRGDYNIVMRKQLAPQLNWTGHSPNQIEDALNYQSFMIKQATESFRRLRPINKHLAGIMPFTILFYNWNGITSFEQMRPKPAMNQLALSYQPILLSWEMWTPQVYAGSRVRAIAHVINDADDGSDLTDATLSYQVRDKVGQTVLSGKIKLPTIAYYETWQQSLALDLPLTLGTGDYVIYGEVVKDKHSVSRNEIALFLAGADWRKTAQPERAVVLYDPSGRTAKALERLNIRTQSADLSKLTMQTTLVIGEGAWDKTLIAASAQLKNFIAAGGRILCLSQLKEKFDTAWLPVPIELLTDSANSPTYLPASRPFRDNMNINPERPQHPIFEGLNRYRLALWSDYTGWDQTKPNFPQLYPVTRGLKLTRPEALARTAILADYDRGLEGIALCEAFDGKGSVILSGFDLINRVGLDPAADRLLDNLVRYAASTAEHYAHPLIEKPIVWGDYSTEEGVVSGPLNGFAVNADWIAPPTNPNATPLTQDEGAWNTRPGDQFVPHGRRLLGLYGYTTAAGIQDLNPASPIGSGIFWARIPAGKKSVVTVVKNPTQQTAHLDIEINDKRVMETASIPSGATLTVRTPLTASTIATSVRYIGEKKLIVLQTSFE